MNGHKLTNSSNSANGTPSSSYPASLSSHSSRDGSPTCHPGGVPKSVSEQSYNWPKGNNDSQVIPTSSAQTIGGSTFQTKTLVPHHISSRLPVQTSRNDDGPRQDNLYNQIPAFVQPSSAPVNSNASQPSNVQQLPSIQFQSQSSLNNQITQVSKYQAPYSQHQPNTFQTTPIGHLPNQSPRIPNQLIQSQLQSQLHQNQNLPQQSLLHQNNLLPNQKHIPLLQSQLLPSQGNKFTQPQNQTSDQKTLPNHNQFSPVENDGVSHHRQYHLYENQTLPSQNQPPQNHYVPQPSNLMYNSANQLPNSVPQISNHLVQPPGNIVNQQPIMQNQPYSMQQPPSQYSHHFSKRYPQMGVQQHGYPPGSVDSLNSQIAGMTVQQGFNKMWGMDSLDLLKCVRDLVPPSRVEPPAIRLQHEMYESANCSPEIFRCTLTKIPETKSLLEKSRLPLGVLIHPFKDLNHLSVIQCTVIVRCRVCRTYINPFVYFVDNKRWKCNLCFRINELPEEFQYDPMTKTYGDPSRRPEVNSATIEFIAPSEYMVRPPQPAVYVFLLDVSRLACECGYLSTVCHVLLAELDNIPGDARTSVSFITFDSSVHFYSLTDGQAQPHQMTVVDIEDIFLPTPENLLVNLSECRELIRDLLQQLPQKYQESFDTHSALGAALQAAYKLLMPTGGRMTVFQASLPNIGPGALNPREDPTQRAGDNPPHLNPATDFYKKLALDCSGQQIAVDLFLVNSQYLDLATISGVTRFSGGCMHHIPLFHFNKPLLVDTLERMLVRYLTRKIGFESVMRLRCTRGLSIHTFHGNFFVRSTDLLSLPNANPDAGFGMQVSIDENLSDVQTVCFQAALLYTSSKGERRIRVHTMCLPIAANLADVMHSADQQCIAGLLAKMAVDRAVSSCLSDAREAFVNVVADVLSAYKLTQSSNTTGLLLAPSNLRLLPLYVLALLKHPAFRVGQSTRLDDRLFSMCQMKSLPLTFLMQSIYPDLYCVTDIDCDQFQKEVEGENIPQPPRLQLSSERVDSHGLYLLDDGSSLVLYVGHNLSLPLCQAIFNEPHFASIPNELFSLPELDNPKSTALRTFVKYLQHEKPFPPSLQVIRDDSPQRMRFVERLVEDKNESGVSYYEFLQQITSIMKT